MSKRLQGHVTNAKNSFIVTLYSVVTRQMMILMENVTKLYEGGVSATFHEQTVSKEASTVPTCHLRALERTYKHNT